MRVVIGEGVDRPVILIVGVHFCKAIMGMAAAAYLKGHLRFGGD